MEEGLTSEGRLRIRESTQDVFVTRGIVERFAIASARKAVRIVELLVLGSGLIPWFAVGDLVFDMMMIGFGRILYSRGVNIGVKRESEWMPRNVWKLSRIVVVKCGWSR